MKTHLRATAHIYLMAALVAALLSFAFAGCSTVESALGYKSRGQEEYERAAQDGYVSTDEMERIDEAYGIDEQRGGWLSTLLNYGVELLGIGGPAGVATAMAVNRMRDGRRRKRGEPVAVKAPPAVVVTTKQGLHNA